MKLDHNIDFGIENKFCSEHVTAKGFYKIII